MHTATPSVICGPVWNATLISRSTHDSRFGDDVAQTVWYESSDRLLEVCVRNLKRQTGHAAVLRVYRQREKYTSGTEVQNLVHCLPRQHLRVLSFVESTVCDGKQKRPQHHHEKAHTHTQTRWSVWSLIATCLYACGSDLLIFWAE